ncbi:cytochrome P450 (plasmid) [Polaromonas sp. JS666]|nr:cytochrome P450 [Polaromonas sp. JS666]
MSHFCPGYPKPREKRSSVWALFRSARNSWIDALYARSYSMQMGEVHLPGVDLYMVNDPALVRRMLSGQPDQFPKSPLLADALRPLLGDSILTTNGDQWQRQREMMNPAFAQAKLDVAFPVMRAAADDLVERLTEAAQRGSELNIEVELTHVTADIIYRTIFSEPLSGDDAHKVFDAFARFQALAPKLMLPSMYGVRWLVWPWNVWQSRRAASDIRRLLEKLIRSRHEAWLRGDDLGKNDILSALMTSRDRKTGEPFSFDELVDQVAVLFLAGHETSASALTWAVYLLSAVPEVQERVHQETCRVFGQRTPEQRDMKALVLTRNVFRETLRLFPPVGFMARESAQTCPMRDKMVPKGASVMISPWLIHRHRERWSDPDAFNPDRFDDDASRESIRQSYLPFGMGPRVCLGAAFALQEATLILASLIRAFRLETVTGHTPMPVGRLTIRSDNGVRLRIFKREDQ